jgi:hypothetical protein
MDLLRGHRDVVGGQEQPCLALIEGQVARSNFEHLAGELSLAKGQDRVPSRSDHESPTFIRAKQRLLELLDTALTLEEMDIVDDHGHIGKAEGVSNVLPQLPALGVLSRIESNDRSGLCSPLPQQSRLAVPRRGRN